MFKYFLIILILYLLTCNDQAFAQSWNTDSVLNKLDLALANKKTVDQSKIVRIENLRLKYNDLPRSELLARFQLAEQLYEEYKSFSYDSAFSYVLNLNRLANQIHDPQRLSSVKVKMGFVFLSSGLFKEAIDTLSSVNPGYLGLSQKIEYYSIFGRTYHDLADYDASLFFTTIYNKVGNSYLEKALELIPQSSFQYYMIHGQEQLKAGQFESARETFTRLYENNAMPEHERAILASTLGYIYTNLKKNDKAIYLLAVAAVADIQSSTKETVALRNLADLLFENGDISRAHRYIKIALEDALFYNARQRKKEVGNVLPIIEGEQLSNTESQRQKLMTYLTVISVLGVAAVVFLLLSLYQTYKLKKVKELLQAANDTMQQTNKKLSEANKIKEKYIGYSFNVNANYLEKINKIQKALSRKIISRQFDDMQEYLKKDLDPEKEREDLNRNFDKTVLSLFPNFVQEFNKLFKPEDQIIVKEDLLLNNELRIFALIRMGISDNEKIAKILNYSVNTIYTYKTKVKNRSKVSNSEFEDFVMKIDA